MDNRLNNFLSFGQFGNGYYLQQALLCGQFWTRSQGCHNVYRGRDGVMDYNTIQASADLDATQITLPGQDLPAGSIYHYVRRKVSPCGLESPDSSPALVVRVADDGAAIGAAPNLPTQLTAAQLVGGKIRLNWHYTAVNQVVSPTGFKIFMDSGSGFDFDTPAATVAADASLARSAGEDFNWTSDALTHDTLYKFCVRSCKTGSGETQNTNYVACRADAVGPDALTDFNLSWEVV